MRDLVATAAAALILAGLAAAPASAAPAPASPVSDAARANALALDVRARMAAWGLRIDYGALPVALVDRPTIYRLSGHPYSRTPCCQITGLTEKQYRIQDGRRSARSVAVSIVTGLSREEFEATVAHEYMHAWMFLDGQPDHVPQLEEGACGLAGYYIHLENGTPLAHSLRERLFKSRSPEYGEGLRRAIAHVQRHGFKGFVGLLRSRTDFPPGT